MPAGPPYRVIDCCEPTDCPVRGAVNWSTFWPGWAMTCHQAVAPSPPPLPASKIACRSQAPASLLWIPLTSSAASTRARTRPAYSDVMIVPGTACFPVSSSREANWEFHLPTSSIITAWDPSIPLGTHISSCCIATTVAPSCARSSHRIALRFAIQVAGIAARKLSFLHPLSLASSHSFCAPFSLLQSSQVILPTFLTYQS